MLKKTIKALKDFYAVPFDDVYSGEFPFFLMFIRAILSSMKRAKKNGRDFEYVTLSAALIPVGLYDVALSTPVMSVLYFIPLTAIGAVLIVTAATLDAGIGIKNLFTKKHHHSLTKEQIREVEDQLRSSNSYQNIASRLNMRFPNQHSSFQNATAYEAQQHTQSSSLSPINTDVSTHSQETEEPKSYVRRLHFP